MITFCNEQGRRILHQLSGQRRLPKNLTDISVAKLLGRRLNDTLLGRTLATKQEMPAQLLRLGTGNYIATTKLLKDDSDQVTGSVLYTVGVNGQRAEDDLRVSQRFTQELAKNWDIGPRNGFGISPMNMPGN